ncbi:helix-turn-helix transcriptional regulator [Clostridium neuense]|uniref:Helix-turn-helix transcriptional regulator n=1 Tax=Clostridium neuense TaxID=1728934 RepID=A0ABW8TFF3_9CLOT
MKNKIREFRKKLGVRQEDIAKAVGVTRQTINAIENQKYNPTLELAMRLAKLLNTKVEELFILDDL